MDCAGSLQWLAFEIALCLMIQYSWTNHVDVNTLNIPFLVTVFIWLNAVTFTLVRKINVVTIKLDHYLNCGTV